jgi:hypothetical protein
VDELVDFFVTDVFSQLLGHLAQVLCGNETSSLVVVQSEDFVNVGPGVLVVDSLGHQGEPFSEVDGSIAIGVEVADHLEDGCTLGLEA